MIAELIGNISKATNVTHIFLFHHKWLLMSGIFFDLMTYFACVAKAAAYHLFLLEFCKTIYFGPFGNLDAK